MQVERVKLDSLTPHPRNPRQGDVGAISESLKAHGQYRPIVVQTSTRHILAGNHTWKAAKALKWKQIDVVWADVSDDEAYRILLVDNRSGDLASYDNNELAALLQELTATELGLEGTGYDGDALDQLVADLNNTGIDPQAEWAGMPEFEHEDQQSYRAVVVHFNSPEAVEDFCTLIGQEFSEKAKYIWHPKLERADFRHSGYGDAA